MPGYYVHRMFGHPPMDYENLIIYPIPPAQYVWFGIQQIPLTIPLCTRA